MSLITDPQQQVERIKRVGGSSCNDSSEDISIGDQMVKFSTICKETGRESLSHLLPRTPTDRRRRRRQQQGIKFNAHVRHVLRIRHNILPLIIAVSIAMVNTVSRVLANRMEDILEEIKEPLPSNITLRAGIMPVAFLSMSKLEYSSFIINNSSHGPQRVRSKFQIDLMERLQIFAQDSYNITLRFELDWLPSDLTYNQSMNLVANDCNTTRNINTYEDCNKFDLIASNYYSNPQRYQRVDFTPSWLRTTIGTIKSLDKAPGEKDYTTLTQASQDKETVCVLDGSYSSQVVKYKFPGAQYNLCPNFECLNILKAGGCVLWAEDELTLRGLAAKDPTLEVTKETISTQYFVWPMRYDLPPVASYLLKSLIYSAIHNGTLDELFHKHFQRELCPIGTAGLKCELPCDPDYGASNTNGECVCISAKWIGEDCSIEVPEDTGLIPQPLKFAAYSMVGFTFAVVTGCAIWLFVKNETAQVLASQPLFLCLVLLGCTISTSTIIALAQEDAGDGPVPACMAIPWLYSVGFSVTFGTLFAKIYRVWTIFRSSVALRRQEDSKKASFSFLFVVLSVDILVLVIWTIVDPLRWERTVSSEDQFGNALVSAGYCTCDRWIVFASIIGSLHLFLLVMASYLCYAARHVPTPFSEGKYVTIWVSQLWILSPLEFVLFYYRKPAGQGDFTVEALWIKCGSKRRMYQTTVGNLQAGWRAISLFSPVARPKLQ